MATGDKIVNLDDLKVAYDALNASKLDKDFSSLDTSGGFSLSDTIPVNISGTTYKITGQTLSNAIGGGGGTQQASLTNYVKNCGTISVLPVTLTDSNITSDMIVIEYTIGDETALGSDWTVTTADGSLTISGTLNKSTTLQLVLSVGYSTTPSILTNLASDTADNVLKASPRPGVTGVLPLTHGGVGSSTASGARTNLSVYSKAETDSAIQTLNGIKPNIYNYMDAICSSSETSSGDVFSYFDNLPYRLYIVILTRYGFVWDDSASMYIAHHGSSQSVYGKMTIKEGNYQNCPKLDANGHVFLPSKSSYNIRITLIQLNT